MNKFLRVCALLLLVACVVPASAEPVEPLVAGLDLPETFPLPSHWHPGAESAVAAFEAADVALAKSMELPVTLSTHWAPAVPWLVSYMHPPEEVPSR